MTYFHEIILCTVTHMETKYKFS